MSRPRLESLFERGELQELLALSSHEASQKNVLDLAVWAHSLVGNLQQCQWHWDWLLRESPPLTMDQMSAIRFSLGVIHTGVGDYTKARVQFAECVRLRRHSLRTRFFAAQGIGFYRYFTGQYQNAARHAAKAFEHASQDQYAFGQMLSEELLGYGLLEAGSIRRGIHYLRTSLKKAQLLQHHSLTQSFRLSLLLNEARFGLRWDVVPRLEGSLEKLHPNDTYSRNSVKLELANQLILRGQIQHAFQVLDEACDSIYATENRLQIAELNFRLAFLNWTQGQSAQATHLLMSAERHVSPKVDVTIWRKMQGLKKQIGGQSTEERPRLSAPGEDRWGDLFQQAKAQEHRALKTILEHRLYYLLHVFYGFPLGQQALLFDLLPKATLVLNQGDIFVIEKGLTRVLRRILEALSAGHRTKADLIQNVWGYSYEPERHDPLVYTSISKLRQLLGPVAIWIESDDNGYRLRSGVHLSPAASTEREKPPERHALRLVQEESVLTYRQIRIMRLLSNMESESLAVEDVQRHFTVSRATATRDLAELTQRGVLQRLGRARATRYILATDRLRLEKPTSPV